ncbi:MAG: NAD(P)-dependent oxidoreductase [Candidatus Magnetobacterium sp. LHC-1]|uniref:NAD(P)-dependent oxidoreductase n=1 Tax=Candidatus Magnetobacterium casense TaxID=1455061 RepID=A0ABS6S075_9BACT|nr:NAD(P)-dependent oxidoreductase [Candidatus Magnetobacterium casensis]MBF0608897.1 NAD(P)-dependent oxidoreductase [Nitrospirota bacterium]MBV6342253.1 NAD(P)-dependent oxidoreductase [Candidatus Magnetobacterium casensis]
MSNADRRLKVGITGAAGVVGTALREGFAGRYDLVLYDMRDLSNVGTVRSMRVDLTDKGQLGGAFDGLDCLIHLAGDPRPDAPPHVTLRNNIEATSYVFEEARRAGTRKIVFASSNFYHQGAVMESLRGGRRRFIHLDAPPSPLCLYAESKVFGEMAGRHLAYLGMQFVALRIGWTVKEDNPRLYAGHYMGAMFVSKGDLTQAFEKAIGIDTTFLPAFVISNNANSVFDLSETREKLGFEPVDKYENYL